MNAPASRSNLEIRGGLLALAASALLAGLYGFIAWRKAVLVVDELSAAGEETLRHLLLALHSASGMLFFAIIGVIMLTRKAPIRREKRLVGWALPITVTLVLAVVGGATPRDYPTPVMVAATFFVVGGTVLTIYALRHLGRHFGVVSDVRGLVTSGPYRIVRHPLYAGETLATIGFVLAVATPVTVLAFVVGIALQIWRARVEEQSLTAAFPEYRAYAARTPMLIPGLKLPGRLAGGAHVAE